MQPKRRKDNVDDDDVVFFHAAHNTRRTGDGKREMHVDRESQAWIKRDREESRRATMLGSGSGHADPEITLAGRILAGVVLVIVVDVLRSPISGVIGHGHSAPAMDRRPTMNVVPHPHGIVVIGVRRASVIIVFSAAAAAAAATAIPGGSLPGASDLHPPSPCIRGGVTRAFRVISAAAAFPGCSCRAWALSDLHPPVSPCASDYSIQPVGLRPPKVPQNMEARKLCAGLAEGPQTEPHGLSDNTASGTHRLPVSGGARRRGCCE